MEGDRKREQRFIWAWFHPYNNKRTRQERLQDSETAGKSDQRPEVWARVLHDRQMTSSYQAGRSGLSAVLSLHLPPLTFHGLFPFWSLLLIGLVFCSSSLPLSTSYHPASVTRPDRDASLFPCTCPLVPLFFSGREETAERKKGGRRGETHLVTSPIQRDILRRPGPDSTTHSSL